MPETETPTVRARQIWEDADSRGHGRKVRIIATTETHALVEVVAGRWGNSSTVGRRSRIRLDRFKPTSTGYRLVRDVEPTP